MNWETQVKLLSHPKEGHLKFPGLGFKKILMIGTKL